MAERAAIYPRVSDPNDLTSATLETQEAGCRAWCAEQGLAVVRVYAERQTGMQFWQRPVLQQLLADAQRGAFDVVVFYSTDRLSRDPEHLAALKVMVGVGGVRLACVTEPIPDDDTGVLVQFVRGWAAKREWGQIRERTIRGRRARVDQGKVPGAGPDLYGWRKDREAGVRVIHEPEARVVRQIYAWFDEGIPIAEIVRRLNVGDTPPPSAGKFRGKPDARWGTGQVRRILYNSAYAGEAYAWQYMQDHERGFSVERPRDEWVRLPEGTVPAIVDRSTWERVQARFAVSRGEWTRNRAAPRRYLLRGLVYCDVCGRRMYSDVDHEYRYYRCSSRMVKGGRCGSLMINAGAVETDVWGRVERAILTPEVIADSLRLTQINDDGALEYEIDQTRAEIARIDATEEQMLDNWRERQAIPWELIERQITRAEREKRAAARHLAELEQRLMARHMEGERLDHLAAWCAHAAERVKHFTFDERRLACEVFGVRVTGSGESWTIEPGWLQAF